MKLRNTYKILITVAMISLTLSGCKSNKELNSYEQGIEALKSENFSEALTCFQACESSGTKKTRLVYRGEGLAYLGLGQYDEALSALKMALSESNGLIKRIDYDINFYMAVAEYKSGRLEDAVNTYTSIISVDKNNSDAYYMRGKVNLDLGKLDEAKADYDQAILLKKENSGLYVNIHDDLMAKGYESDAKAYINTGVANVSKPSSYELGVFNFYLGDYTQARNYFESAAETKKTEEGIIYLGKTYEALNDSAYAIALYEEYINNNQTAAMVFNELGLLKANAKDYEGALQAFEAGINGGGDTCRQPLLFNRIVCNEFLGNFSVANNQMEEYIRLYPDDKTAQREHIFLSSR